MSDENSFSWGSFIRAAIGVVSALGAAVAVFFGVKKATERVSSVNEQQKKENKPEVTKAQEITYYTSQANESCMKYGRLMNGASTLMDALNSIINPEQYQQYPSMNTGYNYNNTYNYGYGYGCGYSQYNGPVVNPLNTMLNGFNQQQPLGNNMFMNPGNTFDTGCNTRIQFNPDGSHRIYTPDGAYAYCTGFPWMPHS